MKNVFLFVLILGFVFACKTGEKKKLSPTPQVAQEKVIKKTDTPIVSAIVGKYNFIDSLNARVFLRAELSGKESDLSLAGLNKFFTVQWVMFTNTGVRERLKSGALTFDNQHVFKEGKYHYFVFDIPRIREQDGAILLVEFIDASSGIKFSYDLNIDFTAQRTISRYEIYDKAEDKVPRFTPYIYAGQPFVIKSINQSDEALFLIKYANKSKPALSPMSNSERNLLSEFEIVETIEVKDRQPLQLEEGMYALTQKPENITDGYGFLVVGNRYPRDTDPNTLREPITYMSTRKEIDGLNAILNGKEGLDLYFLNMAKGDQELARKIIRGYYKRVEEANEIFTSYKEGWKSDKGMVYIIMGPPDRVQRNRQREVWLYGQNKNTSEIIYTFYKKPNVFSDQNYELVRYPEYSAFWFPYVEAWRTGKVVE